jgi:hypothetical protein
VANASTEPMMHAAHFPRFRLRFTVALTLAYWALLGWQYFHGGVPGHSFLARADMPVISNWWGALVVPALTYGLTGLLLARLVALQPDAAQADAALGVARLAFVGALLYGAALATAFTLGLKDISGIVFLALPAIALVLPAYRAEYLLGFILGMTYTFGAVLPTFIGSVAALLSIILHLTVRRAFRWVLSRAVSTR